MFFYTRNRLIDLIPRQIIILSKNIKIKLFRLINKKVNQLENFPVDMFAGTAFYQYPFFYDKVRNKKYFAQFYKENSVTGTVFDVASYVNYRAEILEGRCITSGVDRFTNKHKSLVPISIPSSTNDANSGTVEVFVDGEKNLLEGLKYNSFYYLPCNANEEIKIKSERKFIIGNKIQVKQKNKNSKKLVVTLFIDGLASKIINESTMSKLMPNTDNFFKTGTKFFNCKTSTAWTLPSVVSIASGLHADNHGVTNPRGKIEVGVGYKMLAEYFKDSEYLTAQFCSNQRKNPYYGYMKGFDRTVYKTFMGCDEIVTTAIEHLHSFSERDNYLWLSFFDLHHHLNRIPDISIQKNIPLKFHSYKKNTLNSPFLSYDEKLINWYEHEARRLDLYLQLFYSFVKENYHMDDVIISIVSDHGQAYAGTQKELLSEEKLTTPLMYVGGGVKKTVSKEIVQNIDYLPTLLKLSGIKNEIPLDGNVAKQCGGKISRKFSLSESIYPNDKYEAVIYDNNYMFYLVSNEKLVNLREFNINHCTYRLTKLSDNVDVTNLNLDLCNLYLQYISNHVSDSN